MSRTGEFDAPPPVVDPTVNGVVAATGGRVESVSVVFDHPQGEGSVVTLKTDTVVAYNVGFETASAAVTAGPLAGWTVNPGEGSARFAGATGTAWVLGPETATFTGAGRVSL